MKKRFTIEEFMVVFSIAAILIGMLIPAILKAGEKSKSMKNGGHNVNGSSVTVVSEQKHEDQVQIVSPEPYQENKDFVVSEFCKATNVPGVGKNIYILRDVRNSKEYIMVQGFGIVERKGL